jgi:hypothetical protein
MHCIEGRRFVGNAYRNVSVITDRWRLFTRQRTGQSTVTARVARTLLLNEVTSTRFAEALEQENTSTVAPRVVGGDKNGNLESETVVGLGPEMTSLARASSNCNRQTRPLVREGAQVNKPATDSNKDLVVSPRWVLYSKTDCPAVRRS